MAPGFTAKLGAFDFAQYVRVGPGEGLDPYGSPFEEPIFQDVAIAEGQPLLGEDIKNAERVWPLYLNAASKDTLHTLIRDFEREIKYGVQPQRVEWADKGATNSTFYDVAKARFEPSFSFRQSEHGWFAGNLRVWSQPPYGHTATERIVSTAIATLGVAVATIPALSGDRAALAQYTAVMSGEVPGPAGRALVVGVLPNASYQPFWPPASLVVPGIATVIGASGAPASQVISIPSISLLAGGPQFVPLAGRLALPAAVYAGRHRLLAAVRPGNLAGIAVWAHDNQGMQVGPTAVARTYRDGFMLADLGVVSVPSNVPTSLFTFGFGQVVQTADAKPLNVTVPAIPAGQVGGIFLVAEDGCTVQVDALTKPQAGKWFAASGAASAALSSDDLGNTVRAGDAFSVGLYTDASGLHSGINLASVSTFGGYFTVPGQLNANLRARAAVAITGTPVDFAGAVVGKQSPDGLYMTAKAEHHASTPRISLLGALGITGGTVSAFLPLQPTSLLGVASTLWLVEMVSRNDEVYVNLRLSNATGVGIYTGGTWGIGPTTVPVACVGVASTFTRQVRGLPMLGLQGTSAMVAALHWQHDQLTGYSTPSDSYLLDGVTDTAVTTQPTYGAQDRTIGVRGRIPKQVPSGGRVVAFDAQIDGGPMNDPMSVSIAVRERFTFAR